MTRLYADFQEDPEVKIFANNDFGFHRITVERPLKLNFQASPERIARLEAAKGWQALATSKKKGAAGEEDAAKGRAPQAALLEVLRALDREVLYQDREAFTEVLKAAIKKRQGRALGPSVLKVLLETLSERDETAAVCRFKGEPEPDPELRGYENVPLGEDIAAYMARDVLPHVPDAWVDHGKTKVGYEIPFTRHFYVYQPPRPLAVIRAEIEELEREIQGMLGRVLE